MNPESTKEPSQDILGMDSPVSALVSIAELPSVTTPFQRYSFSRLDDNCVARSTSSAATETTPSSSIYLLCRADIHQRGYGSLELATLCPAYTHTA
jgi:hypothetical protein